MKSNIFSLVVALILIATTVGAACTVTFDKASYYPTETITADMVCTGGTETSKAYVLTWRNSTGTGQIIQYSNGTTPSSTGVHFYATHLVSTSPSYINATLTGTNLEGDDTATISSASTWSLLIQNITFGGGWLGRPSSVTANVLDENSRTINGGICQLHVLSNDGTKVYIDESGVPIVGALKISFIPSYSDFEEGQSYLAAIACSCGSNSSSTGCSDSIGNYVESSYGSATYPISMLTWLTFNDATYPITYSNGTAATKDYYAGFDYAYWNENITNNYDGALVIKDEYYLRNYDTWESFAALSSTGAMDALDSDNSKIRNIRIPADIRNGTYFIQNIKQVYYNNGNVAGYVQNSGSFEVYDIPNYLVFNGDPIIRDYWANKINTTSATQSKTTLPTINYTNYYYVLSEGFKFDFCLNVTNSYSNPVMTYMDKLELVNPTLQKTYSIVTEGAPWVSEILGGTTELMCYRGELPFDLVTHSDWFMRMQGYIGNSEGQFICEDQQCSFTSTSDYFYIGKISDMIETPKWLATPNATSYGNPGVYVVTEDNQYLYMLDDYTYQNQTTIDWGNATYNCTDKNAPTQGHLCDMSVFPIAGERIKVCFEARNHFANEMFVDFFNIYIDNDDGDSVRILSPDGWYSEDGMKSAMAPDLWASQTLSRAVEGDGNLIDGYASICTDWLWLPPRIDGGNNWDIQGNVYLKKDQYLLSKDVFWTWESDEFPIFGKVDNEINVELIDITNLTTSAYAPATNSTVSACTPITVFMTYDFFDTHDFDLKLRYCFGNIENENIMNCYDTQINPDYGRDNTINATFVLPYYTTSSEADVRVTAYRVDMSANYYNGGSEVLDLTDIPVGFSKNIGATEGLNEFNVTAVTTDTCYYSSDPLTYRSTAALEGIENKTGTFHLDVDCGDTTPVALIGVNGLLSCEITAYVEDTQTVEKEVDFTCSIEKDGTVYGSTNWNSMINRTALTFTKTFTIPVGVFGIGSYIPVECTADYYNFGSREDSFSDSVLVAEDPNNVGAGAENPLEANITIEPVVMSAAIVQEQPSDYSMLLGIMIIAFMAALFLIYRRGIK